MSDSAPGPAWGPRLLLLLLLLAMAVSCAQAAGRPAGATTTKLNEPPELKPPSPHVALPPALASLLSPLDLPSAAELVAALRGDGRFPPVNPKLCALAHLFCDANAKMVAPTIAVDARGGEVVPSARDGRAGAFAEKDMVMRGGVPMPPHDEMPNVTFLPKSIADLLPLASTNLPTFLNTFDVPSNSNMAAMMAHTYDMCHVPVGENPRSCITSVEDMVDFVATYLPKDAAIKPLPLSSPTPGHGGGDNGSAVKVVTVQSHERSVMCHKNMFPFAVFLCHTTTPATLKIYSATMTAGDNKLYNSVAACHVATTHESSARNAKRPPCHWVSDAFVWVPTN